MSRRYKKESLEWPRNKSEDAKNTSHQGNANRTENEITLFCCSFDSKIKKVYNIDCWRRFRKEVLSYSPGENVGFGEYDL